MQRSGEKSAFLGLPLPASPYSLQDIALFEQNLLQFIKNIE